jgi:DNA repair and recombination protein RAD52
MEGCKSDRRSHEAVKGSIGSEIDEARKLLGQFLGPEFISYRKGEGGMRLAYIEGHRVISLANEIFGFDGWSSHVVEWKVETEELSKDGTWFVEVVARCKVVLAERYGGVSREDFGYGSKEKVRQRGKAKENALKEAVTDGLKRVFRQFGEATGNCIYNKEYLSRVTKIRSVFERVSWDEDDLYRLVVNRGSKRRCIEERPSGSNSLVDVRVTSGEGEDLLEFVDLSQMIEDKVEF